ncbi:MAG: hypothetical protein ACLFTQ_02785 [Candidatus Aenigmatarchaeota archaeon]
MAKVLRIDDFSDVELSIKSSGIPNPQGIYTEVVDILRMECNINENDINEKKYSHEKQRDTEVVSSEIRAYKGLDKFSKLYFKIKIFIEMKPAKAEEYDYVGDVEIRGTGRVRTEYPQENWLQQSILWHAFRVFYEKLIYGDVKEVYIQKCNKYMRILRDDVKSYFDMLPTVR